MATGQDLLDRMEVLNEELQLQPGETDVVFGLRALNIAQDQFEAAVAVEPDILGSSFGSVVTAPAAETTIFPAGLLRLDDLWYVDASGLPARQLDDLKQTGGHRLTTSWPLSLAASTSPGSPSAYWTNGSNIFWSPLPDAVYSVRWYGFQAAANITAGGTFGYPDIAMLPICVFAVKMLATGLNDSVQDLTPLTQEVFNPVIATLGNFNRTGASPLQYRYSHNT